MTIHTPLPFQLEDAKWLLTKHRAAVLSEQGTGKSVVCATALVLLAVELGRKVNVLVICPKSACLVWEDVFDLYADYLHISTALSHAKLVKPELAKAYAKGAWDVVILDEGHQFILRTTAKRCINLLANFSDAPYSIWYTSGTPASKSAVDYYPLFTLMEPGTHGTEYAFGKKYCYEKYDPYKQVEAFTGFKNTDELKECLSRFAIRRTKALLDLPEKFYTILPVKVSDEILSQCLDMERHEVIKALAEREQLDGPIATIMRSIGLAKVPAVVDYIKDNNYSKENPVVLFTWTKEAAQNLKNSLNTEAFPVCTITGDTPQNKRKEYIQDFQSNKYAAIVVNMKAGGTGITLTAASSCIYVDLPVDPIDYAQSQDRIHRIGAKRNVNIIHAMARNTFDEIIYYGILRKKLDGIAASMI